MSKHECCICCEDVEDVLACPACGEAACYACTGEFLVSEPREPCCMFCKGRWSYELVLGSFDKKWLRSTFFPAMGRLWMEREKDLLPSTQVTARNELRLRALSRAIRSLPTNDAIRARFKKSEKDAYEAALQAKREEKQRLEAQKREIVQQTATVKSSGRASGSVADVPVMVMMCPCEGCRGYVEKRSMRCGICSSLVCERCRQCVKERDGTGTGETERHTCRPEDVETARLIRSECRNCPKCTVPIFKTGGCDQMFCTHCNTAFSWTTGKVETGAIHNPYYFEWLANRDRNAQHVDVEAIACGEVPDDWDFMQRMKQPHGAKAVKAYQRMVHTREVCLPMVRANRVRENDDLRIDYLLEEIDEDQWISKLVHRERRRMKQQALREVVEMAHTILADIVRRLYVNVKNTNLFQETLQEYWGLNKYMEEAFDRIVSVHGGLIPHEIMQIIE